VITDQKPVRTIKQNKSLHKYFSMLAESLNNAGKDVLTVLNSDIEIEWTGELVELFKDELAIILNDAGLTFNCALGKGSKSPWTEGKVKALIWHKVQKMQLDIDSTTKLDTEQVSKVYEVINRHTSSTFGVSVVFPSKD
jgi:hypothetical protein